MSNTHTYTVATMAIPASMHRAILRRLQEADYVHAIGDDGQLDMAGIGLVACNTTNTWWHGDTAWHPATIEACLERIEEMREEWSVLAKLLGFDTYADPEQILAAVRCLKEGAAADLDDDAHALELARRFTSDNDPQERASLQVAIVNAMARARSAQQASDSTSTALPEGWVGGHVHVEGVRIDWFSSRSSEQFAGLALIDTALGYMSTALDDLDSSPDPRPAGMLKEAIACIRQAMLGGIAAPEATEVFAPEYFSRNAGGEVAFTEVAPNRWPDWADAKQFAPQVLCRAQHAELLELIGATTHEEATGLIAHWRGSALTAIRHAEVLDRRLTDAMRLAWMLVNAGGGSVTIKWEDLAKVDWSTAHLHREEDPEMRGLTLRAKP